MFFLFCHYVSYGQKKENERPLTTLITELEQRFNCSFSYADSDVITVYINYKVVSNDLNEILKDLERITSLKFSLISENQIVISSTIAGISICGYLTDSDTGEVVQNGSVVAGNNYTISDETGYFKIGNIQPGQLVRIVHLGYKSIAHPVEHWENNTCKTLLLIPKVEQIKEITIRNYLTKGIRKTSGGSYNIDYKNFGILPGLIEPDVLQTIQSLPGVQSVDESVSNINIRGGAHHENLITWDGIKMYQSGHFFGLISAFNPMLTKKVDLIKNGTSARFSDGVSGTIAMATDNVLNRTANVKLGVNLINADVFVDVPVSDQASLQIASRRGITDFVQTPAYKQYFNKAFQDTELINSPDENINTNDEFSFYDVNVRGIYKWSPDNTIRVNFLNFSNDLKFLENAVINNETTSRESKLGQNNLAFGLQFEGVMTDRLQLNFQSYFTLYTLKAINVDIINEQQLFQENEVLEEAFKLDIDYKLTDVLWWKNAYQYTETGVTNIQDVDNPLYVAKIKEVIRAHGLSSELAYQSPSRNTTIRGGLRFSYLEKFGKFILEPRWAFNHNFSEHVSFELLAEMKHQYTTQIIDFQNDFLGIENRRWQLMNNQDIPLIRSEQVSSGIHYNSTAWLLSLEGFYKRVEGITSQSQGFQNQFRFEKSTGEYSNYGVELLINRRFPSFSTWLSYSYMDNMYLFKDLSETRFPSNFDLTHTLNLGGTFTHKRLKLSGGFHWHTGKPTTEPIANVLTVNSDEISYAAPNSSRLDDFLRLDLSLQYEWRLKKNTKLNFGISLWNVLDEKNIVNSYYKVIGSEVVRVDQTSLGFTPNTSFRLTF